MSSGVGGEGEEEAGEQVGRVQRADGDGGLLCRGRRECVEHPVKVVEVAAVEFGVFPEGAERAVGEPGGLDEAVGEPGPGGLPSSTAMYPSSVTGCSCSIR